MLFQGAGLGCGPRRFWPCEFRAFISAKAVSLRSAGQSSRPRIALISESRNGAPILQRASRSHAANPQSGFVDARFRPPLLPAAFAVRFLKGLKNRPSRSHEFFQGVFRAELDPRNGGATHFPPPSGHASSYFCVPGASRLPVLSLRRGNSTLCTSIIKY